MIKEIIDPKDLCYTKFVSKNIYNQFLKTIISDFDIGLNEALLYLDEGYSKSFIKISTDGRGYPIHNSITTMNTNRIPKFEDRVSENLKPTNIIKREIYIDKPLAVIYDPLDNWDKVLIWKGRLFGEDWQNIENLDVLEMQKIVSEAINKQDCIILDNAKNIVEDIEDIEKIH